MKMTSIETCPKKLFFEVYPSLSKAFRYKFENHKVIYEIKEPQGRFVEAARFNVSGAQWKMFWQCLQDVSAAKWASSYMQPEGGPPVADGTAWRFECSWQNLKVKSHGNNAYPVLEDVYLSSCSDKRAWQKILGFFESLR